MAWLVLGVLVLAMLASAVITLVGAAALGELLAGVGEAHADGLRRHPAPPADRPPLDALVDELDHQPVPPLPLALQLVDELRDPVG